MRQDDRAAFDRALERARRAAYGADGFVGQESFMRPGEILELARRAGIRAGGSVLDLCCGVGGPGRLITAELGCAYLGVDASPSAVTLARARTDGLACRFEVAAVPPLPHGTFDVVLLLETMLAFADKNTLLREVASALRPGGRFAFTIEEGEPLTEAEREAMPDADTVLLVPVEELRAGLEASGLEVVWEADCTAAHRQVAEAMAAGFRSDAAAIAAAVGQRALDELVTAHRLWTGWLGSARVRKLALVARKAGESRLEPGGRPHRSFR